MPRSIPHYCEGPVVDNKDPMKLGRVRVRIPGIAEPTGWALPLNVGGGMKDYGSWHPPRIGAEVGVFFKNGDPDHPRYIGGPYGANETPAEVQEASVAEAADDVPYILATRRWRVVLDERRGKTRAAIEDRKTGDMFEIDGVKLGVKIKSTAALSIECDGAVDIKGSSITLNGRRLAPNRKPI